MVVSILITQCLQNDFIQPIGAQEPLPNLLHVGREESQRLLGPEPAAGPLAQLMNWARAQDPGPLRILHVRDWHDPEDERQREHLDRFGNHCLRGTDGARLVLGLDEDLRSNERLIDSITLNDFEGTELPRAISEIKMEAGGEPLRAAVIGVWTEAKVSFLLYDLKTRCGFDSLATCSALDASASRLQHFNALEQLRKILGVQVFNSVGDLAEWLLPTGTAPRPPELARRFAPAVEIRSGDAGCSELPQDDRDILSFLYRDSSKVSLTPMAGGFSGASVFRVVSNDATREHAPSVVKLGPRGLIGSERAAFERVEPLLGNSAPSVKGFVDLGQRAGIKYAFASMGGSVRTFKSLYESGVPVERIAEVLEQVFEEVLGRFYSGAQYERLPLLEHYGFAPRVANSVRVNLARLLGEEAASRERLAFAGGFEAHNLVGFYETFLADAATLMGQEYHYVSYVHGDLNGANILVDGRGNVWVIDFFHSGPGHVLKDLAKLENDLLYIYTPVTDEDESMLQAVAITRALRRVEDLHAPLPEEVEGVRDEPFRRAWQTLRTMRGICARLCREDRSPVQMSVALLRYAAHTLGFDESSTLQKKWALAAACGHAEDIILATHANRRLRVDWIDVAALPAPGRLGITLCPGRRDRGRSLAEDLDVLAELNVARLVSLCTDPELEWAGVVGMEAECARRGIELRKMPIRDQSVPSAEEAADVIHWMRETIDSGGNVALHCMAGLGRSGTIAACLLAAARLPPADAIAAVRSARGPRAVETAEQERFVEAFARST